MKDIKQNKEISQAIKKIANQYGLILVYVFGSRARGDNRQNSDMDIAYLSQEKLDYKKEYILNRELKKILSCNNSGFDMAIDLVDIRTARPILRYRIIIEGIKLFGSDHDDDFFYRESLKMYIDNQRIFQFNNKYIQSYVN